MTRRESNKISQIFNAVQKSKTCHQNYIKKLRKIFDNCELEYFTNEFISNLRIPLTYMERATAIEYVLQFCAKFLISIKPLTEDDDDDDMCPFLLKIFDFLLIHYNAKEVAVRYRICYFLNMLLDTMGDNASIEDELCTRILHCMLERFQDKSPRVRAQAAIALHRLQEPLNPNCQVIKMYMIHVSRDPSAEVRRVILAKMAKNKLTLHAALKRTNDTDDSVRKMAYLFISKITVKSLTISQREKIIIHGLKDRSDVIKKCVRGNLLPAWLRYYDNNYIQFMKAVDAEQAPETVALALKCLFENADITVLMDQITLDNDKFIPLEELNCETVLYWRCLAEFLKSENYTDEFERIMPELSPLCLFIKNFLRLAEDKTSKQWDQISQQFILLQLFETVKLYDLSDELGRKNLKELIIETLTSETCSDKISQCLVKYFEEVVPDTNDRIALLVDVINEKKMPTKSKPQEQIPLTEDERHHKRMQKAKLGVELLELEDEEYTAIQSKDYAKAQAIQTNIQELKAQIDQLSVEASSPMPTEVVYDEKDDPETVFQCLKIMYYMMQSKSIQILTPTLRTLMDSLVIPCLNVENTQDQVLPISISCLGLCCHIDKELAKKYLMILFLKITESGNEELWVSSAQVIFDLLLKHGLEFFDIPQASNDKASNISNKRGRSVRLYSHTDEDTNVNDKEIEMTEHSNNVVKVLMAFLDSHVEKLQNVAVEGLCKLILHRRISSVNIITQLLILWHNPTIKDNIYLSQCLCTFFNYYVNKVPDSYTILEEAYLPTLKIISEAPDMSPLQEIDILRVSQVILNLTCYNIHNTYSVHNNLTFIIISEILNPENEIPSDILVKSLKFLDVQFESQDSKMNILKGLENIEELITDSHEKRLLICLKQFKMKIEKEDENTSKDNENINKDGENSNNSVENMVQDNTQQQNNDQTETME